MKKYFIELAQYNVWANQQLYDWLLQIDLEQWQQPFDGSFKSIEATTLHIASAEKIWVERMQGMAQPFMATSFSGSRETLIEIWQKLSNDLLQFVIECPSEKFEEKFAFKNLKGEDFNMPYYQALAHVFNHSTYHRGQLVNYLRQVGFTGVSSTDLINFYRTML